MLKDEGRREILTVREVADYLHCHQTTIYRLIRTGQIPAFRLIGSWRFKLDAIDHWMQQAGVTARAIVQRPLQGSEVGDQ